MDEKTVFAVTNSMDELALRILRMADELKEMSNKLIAMQYQLAQSEWKEENNEADNN